MQVDATPPSLEISCPEMVAIGSSASATYSASDAYSGLASPASGTIPINTSTAGTKTVSTTAVSNVGFETTKSCSTMVGYYVVVSGPVNGNLTVRSGEAVELTSTAKVSGSVKVKPGGALDVEGASITGSLTSTGAALLRDVRSDRPRSRDRQGLDRLGRDRRKQRLRAEHDLRESARLR